MKRILTIMSLLATGVSAIAAPLTPEEALSRSMQSVRRLPGAAQAWQTAPAYLACSEDGIPSAYVFNSADGDGYVILSADDVAYPVLGYSDSGSFNSDNMPPAMKWWLGEYGRQIEFARSKSAAPSARMPYAATVSGREAISPLVSTRWNQDAPYNDQCPKDNGVACVTGCVATSMAQLMNYFKYPEVGEGIKQYVTRTLKRKLTLNFGKTEFDWDNMLDYYSAGNYTEEQASAVAYLMKACGYSVEMDYTTGMSGAVGDMIAYALRTYFNYDSGCHVEQRLPYSWNEWDELIYNNLKNVGPVVLNGQSPLDGGHSFVCDGYDGNGYYHFNWGWGGVSDGYYALDALNPDAQGIGGYAGGFNFSQDVIIGAQKPTGEPPVDTPPLFMQYGATVASVEDGTLTFDVTDYSPLGWGNGSDRDIIVNVGAMFESLDNPSEEKITVQGLFGNSLASSFTVGSYIPAGRGNPNVAIPAGLNGRYKVTLVYKIVEEGNEDWYSVKAPWGCPNYTVLVADNGAYSVENVPLKTIEIKEAHIDSELYNNCNFRMVISVENNSDIDLTQGVSPVLLRNGREDFIGQSILVTLGPGEKKEVEWIAKFERASNSVSVTSPTEYVLSLVDPQTTRNYGDFGTVVMNPSPGSPRLGMNSIGIVGCETKEQTINDYYFARVFMVEDLKDFVFDLDFKVNSGYFDGQLIIDLCDAGGENPYSLIPMGDPLFSNTPLLAAGESFKCELPIQVDNLEKDHLYAVRVQYTSNYRLVMLGSVYFIDASYGGVDDIAIGEGQAPVYYNLQGVAIENPQSGDIVIERIGTKARKVIVK